MASVTGEWTQLPLMLLSETLTTCSHIPHSLFSKKNLLTRSCDSDP